MAMESLIDRAYEWGAEVRVLRQAAAHALYYGKQACTMRFFELWNSLTENTMTC